MKMQFSDINNIIIGYKGIIKVAKQIAQEDDSVLITGESGVGKNLFARLIHQESSRKSQLFHHIYCPNIQTLLFDSEFFGHRKGSFTGANDDKIGALEFADKGTLFLDEIGDLIIEFQSKFLSILENNYI